MDMSEKCVKMRGRKRRKERHVGRMCNVGYVVDVLRRYQMSENIYWKALNYWNVLSKGNMKKII